QPRFRPVLRERAEPGRRRPPRRPRRPDSPEGRRGVGTAPEGVQLAMAGRAVPRGEGRPDPGRPDHGGSEPVPAPTARQPPPDLAGRTVPGYAPDAGRLAAGRLPVRHHPGLGTRPVSGLRAGRLAPRRVPEPRHRPEVHGASAGPDHRGAPKPPVRPQIPPRPPPRSRPAGEGRPAPKGDVAELLLPPQLPEGRRGPRRRRG